MGCVRSPQEGELARPPPLSPKRRLRFRRKHKAKKKRKVEAEKEKEGYKRANDSGSDEDLGIKKPAVDPDLTTRAGTLITVPDTRTSHSKHTLHSNTLSQYSSSSSAGVAALLGNRILEASPKPSPAWRGVFCLPGQEDTFSAVIDVSSLPSQTTTTTPVNTAPALGSTTPGGGRVLRVREKVQGVLEKPWILRQKKERKDKGRGEKGEKGDVAVKRGHERTLGGAQTTSFREHKDVVHIREVDGKLCVVRTMYPSDYGSPVWKGQSDTEVEILTEPPAPSPITGNVLKVLLSEEDMGGGTPFWPNQLMIHETSAVGGFRLDSAAQAQDRMSLLESGYASDLPLTSPETAGTTPSQTDWGGLTSSSSERLDSVVESPSSVQLQTKLPQVCFLTVRCCVY